MNPMGVSQGALGSESGPHRCGGRETCTQEEEEARDGVSYDSQEARPEDTSSPETLGRLKAPAGARVLLLPPRREEGEGR